MIELSAIGVAIVTDRTVHETLVYFVGTHFLKCRCRREAIRTVHRLKLHHHDFVRRSLLRLLLLAGVGKHNKLVNAVGFGLLCTWFILDLISQAAFSAYVVDTTRISIGLIALKLFGDYM